MPETTVNDSGPGGSTPREYRGSTLDHLMRTVTRDGEAWRDHAACKGKPTEWFFPTRGVTVEPEAARLCAACPVKDDCREAAIETHWTVGYWGGTSHRQRRLISRQRAAERKEAEQ